MNPEEIADISLASARRGLDEAVKSLLDAVDGDWQILLAASKVVAAQQAKAEGPEHIAFTYLTAAYRQMTGT